MKPSDKEPRILFEDRHLCIVNKPVGWLCQKDQQTQLECIEDWVLQQWMSRTNRSGFAKAVHRLDVPASGLVVCALSSKAARRMQESIRVRLWQKHYLILVGGKQPSDCGELCHWLLHKPGKSVLASPGQEGAQEARLSYQWLSTHQDQHLVAVKLITGRYHQIRAQFAAMGHPVVGDRKYGSAFTAPDGAIALHHAAVKLPHPVAGTPVVASSLPAWAGSAGSQWLNSLLPQLHLD